MKPFWDTIHEAIQAKPAFAGAIGAATAWVSAAATWFDVAHKFILFMGCVFGTVAGFYTMLIVMRNWKNGNRIKKNEENG